MIEITAVVDSLWQWSRTLEPVWNY